MATVTITLDSVCSGQGHVHLDTQVNAGAVTEYMFHIDELLTGFTEEERRDVLRGILKLHAIGKTRAQMRTALQNGLTVTV